MHDMESDEITLDSNGSRETPKAKKFDFTEMFQQAHALAKERNHERNVKALIESASDTTSVVASTSEKTECKEPEIDKNRTSFQSDKKEKPKLDENEVDYDDRNPYHLPTCNDMTFSHGSKPLTALGVDPSGARFATGGLDFDVKLWDFGGMDGACRPFKIVQPCEEHQTKHLEFSPSGEHILVISGSAQAHVINRDGDPVCFTNKGFQYITDPASAKGHTHGLNWGTWHPLDVNKLLTCSQDATLRIWDMNDAETILNEARLPTHKSVLKPRNAQGRKTIATACAYSKDGHLIICGCQDGSIQMWDTRKPLVNTSQLIRNAHPANTDVTCLAWAWDGRQFGTRATDDTMRIWDARALSKGAVHLVRDLPVLFDQTELTFSPNDHIICTAVSASRGDPLGGRVAFLRRDTCKPLHDITPNHGSVIRVVWHHRINQLFCTSSDGSANVHYDPQVSHNGAMMVLDRQSSMLNRRRHMGSNEAYVKPYLLMYDDEGVLAARKNKRLLENPAVESVVAVCAINAMKQKERMSANAVRNEQVNLRVPPQEEKLGNRVGSLHQYMVQQIVLQKNDAEERAEKDIRGAILRHADAAKEKPFWTKAYQKTQPNPVFYDPDKEFKQDETPLWKKRKLA